MKAKFTYIGLMAFLVSACGTGSYITNSYTDDIYFNPSDVPPPITVTEKAPAKTPLKSESRVIVSEIRENEDGSNTMNNYIFRGTESDINALQYNADMGLEASDTTIYYNDDEVKYVINNYYNNDDVDFAYRIYRFHNPRFYDPFYWNSWYYDPYWYGPGWSWSFGWGWDYPYYSWGYPYNAWGYPYYGWGYPYYGWGYPYYGRGYYSYWGGYYPYYWGGGYYRPVYVIDSDNYKYGQRRSTGTNVNRNDRFAPGGTAQGSSGRNKSGGSEYSGINNDGRNTSSYSGRRDGSVTSGGFTKSNNPDGNVLTERRRSTEATRQAGIENNVNSTGRSTQSQIQGSVQSQSYTRPGTSSQSRTYTRPSSSTSSYNTQPRVVNQSSVNSSGASGVYSQPKSTSTYNQSYRSSSTYSRSSSSGTTSRSYSVPSSSSSSGTYRSSSSGNYNSGSSGSYSSGSSGSYSSGSSGSGSFSGGSSGGGSRSSGSGSSSSGRR